MANLSRESKVHESFLHEASEVDNLVNMLEEILKGKKEEKTKSPGIKKNVSDFSYVVFEKSRYSTIKKSKTFVKKLMNVNMNQMTFMRQVDNTDEERAKVRKERIVIATHFRKLGNTEYRKFNYDKAIQFYSHAIQYIPDSPVLYVNRSICLIKKRSMKLASMDLDFVLTNLDPFCVRALLLKAGVVKRMDNDEATSEQLIAKARLYGRSQCPEYVENFVIKMKSDF